MNNPPEFPSECPLCHGTVVYEAAAQEGEGGGIMLRKQDRRRFYVWSVPSVSFPTNVFVCCRCGFLWSKVDPTAVRSMMLQGNEDFVRTLATLLEGRA